MSDLAEMSKTDLVAYANRQRNALARQRREERDWGDRVVEEAAGGTTAVLIGAVDEAFGEGAIMGANVGAVVGAPLALASVFVGGTGGRLMAGAARGMLLPEGAKLGRYLYRSWNEVGPDARRVGQP